MQYAHHAVWVAEAQLAHHGPALPGRSGSGVIEQLQAHKQQPGSSRGSL